MKYIAFDTETTGLNPWLGAEVFAFSTCDVDGKTEVWRLDGKDGNDPEEGKWELDKLIMRAKKGDVCLVMANAKFDLRMTEHYLGFRFAEDIQFEDVLIQSHILRNDHYSHRLKDLAWDYAGIPKDDETAIKPYVRGLNAAGEEVTDYSRVPAHLMHEYQRQDAIRTMLLHLFMREKIQPWDSIYKDELDLIVTTLRMEERGIMLNVDRCLKLSDELKADAERVLDDCEAYMGHRVNLGNDNRVREMLYDDLEFAVSKTTDSGLPSIDKDALRALKDEYDHPALDWVLQYKSWSRGSNTVRKYTSFADGEDIIHPDIRTCGAGTGRESCSKPNLQNVAKEKNFMNPYPVPARKAFRPRPGYVNFHLDYSGIEFRLAVILTEDDTLLDLVRAGEDLHVMGARILFGEEEWDAATEEQQGEMRGGGKSANFGKMYGAGLATVSATIGREVTRETFRRYDEVFGALDKSAKRIVDGARKNGYVETLMGRRLWVPADKPYVGTNYKIQGSAAEILKVAQVRVHRYLESELDGEPHLLLPIHDEVIIEWPRELLSDARQHLREVRRLMVDFPLDAPLDVDVEVATVDWSQKKGYKL